MRYWLIITMLLLSGCGGELWFTPNGHRAFYKSKDGQLSCYTDNCCWPYKEQAMICTQADGVNGATMYLKVKLDK
jgi:hypothetical protein